MIGILIEGNMQMESLHRINIYIEYL